LRGAFLYGADLTDARLPYYFLYPETGQFKLYKKAKSNGKEVIVTLVVSKSALRIGGLTERKIRVSKAKIKSIQTLGGKELFEAVSHHDSDFVYKTGKWIEVDDFVNDIKVVCGAGIHGFITLKEAKEYRF
jgi:hypothetical protein